MPRISFTNIVKNLSSRRKTLELIRKYAFYCKLQNSAPKHSDLLAVSVPDTAASVVHAFRSNFAIFVAKPYLRISS